MSPTAQREQVEVAGELLDWVSSEVNEEEREHLALELLDATRQAGDVRYLLNSWAATVTARSHPDFAAQVKEYKNIVDANELYVGVNLSSLQPLA
jgi:hypothetical protein